MRIIRTVAALVLTASPFCSANSDTTKPSLSKSPLTADQIAVYRAFLASYDNGAPGPINLGNRTTPLQLSEGDTNGCLSGITLENPAESRTTVHLVGPEVIEGKDVRLVDAKQQTSLVRKNDPSRTMRGGKSVEDAVTSAFASGLLQVSEIAFDRTRRYAVTSFSFYCGGLCGHGATLVFEKVGSDWKPTKRTCGNWIS